MSRKGENLYKRKDGRWEGRYIKSRTPTGKAIYGYVYASTYRDAKIKLRQAAVSIPGTRFDQPKSAPLFSEIATAWIESIEAQIKVSTANKYRNILSLYLYPFFEETPINLITQNDIEKCCRELLVSGGRKKTGLSPKTVSDTLSVIRSVLRFAVRNGNTVQCDGNGVQIKQTQRELRILSKAEQETLFQYLHSHPTPCNVGILISLCTGLRIGEVCALKWDDISFAEQTIHVHHTMQRVQTHSDEKCRTKVILSTPKSACSNRIIPITDDLLMALRQYQSSADGFVMTNSKSQYIEPRTLQNHFNRVLKSTNIAPANFHALRHTFATRCVEVGFDIKSLSEILGHATVNITMNRYVHPSLDLKKENMKRLSDLFTVK